MTRAFLAAALFFILVFATLTIRTAVVDGPSVLTVLSIIVLAMLGCGLFGAMREG
jgi:hypothetical protein